MRLSGITGLGLKRISKYYRRAESFDSPSEEMQAYFLKRTHKHINLVGKYCEKIFNFN